MTMMIIIVELAIGHDGWPMAIGARKAGGQTVASLEQAG